VQRWHRGQLGKFCDTSSKQPTKDGVVDTQENVWIYGSRMRLPSVRKQSIMQCICFGIWRANLSSTPTCDPPTQPCFSLVVLAPTSHALAKVELASKRKFHWDTELSSSVLNASSYVVTQRRMFAKHCYHHRPAEP